MSVEWLYVAAKCSSLVKDLQAIQLRLRYNKANVFKKKQAKVVVDLEMRLCWKPSKFTANSSACPSPKGVVGRYGEDGHKMNLATNADGKTT